MASLMRNCLRASKLFSSAIRKVGTQPSQLLADAERYFIRDYQLQYLNRLPQVVPLNLILDPALAGTPTLNVLIPQITIEGFTGGPNTVINLCCRIASQDVPVRLISTDRSMGINLKPIWKHIELLSGTTTGSQHIELCCAYDRSKPLCIGENDVFFGTAWWTVQIIKHALALTNPRRFIYMIQDFEAGFYSWSAKYALALETYDMNFRAVINERFLADFLCEQRIGRFADPSFINQCVVFEPAIDSRKFFRDSERISERRRRLLFYARPSVPRNLFDLGLYALHSAVMTGVFSGAEWEMFFIGEALPAVELGGDTTICSRGWLNYDTYAEFLRSSDIVLALMLSPHTSYPPLEIAACGGIAVTNTFACKTAEKLRKISPNIVAVQPTPEGILSGIREAVKRVREKERCYDGINMPEDWNASLARVIPKAVEMFHDCLGST